MKNLKWVLSAMLLMGWVSWVKADGSAGVSQAVSTKVQLTGTLVCVDCYLSEGAVGNNEMKNKSCGTNCLDKGKPAGLLVGKKLYILVCPASAFSDDVGRQVEVIGDLYGPFNLVPEKASVVAKDGTKKAVNLKGKGSMVK